MDGEKMAILASCGLKTAVACVRIDEKTAPWGEKIYLKTLESRTSSSRSW